MLLYIECPPQSIKFFKPGGLLKNNETALTFSSFVEELQNCWWKPAEAIMIEWGWPCQGSKPLPSEFVAEIWSIIIITSDSEESSKVWALGSNLREQNVKISLIMQIVWGVRKRRKIVLKYSFHSVLQQSYLQESSFS